MFRHLRLGVFTLGFLLVATTAQAADLDKISRLLPDETETVMAVNIRQILDSAVVKKYGLDKLKDAIDSQGEIKDYLKDMGLDPLKDIDSIIVGSAGNTDTEKGLFVITGRFDPEKLEAKATELAKDKPDFIKEIKLGKRKAFEINAPNSPQAVFAAVADKKMILAASSKGALEDALEKHAGNKTTKLKNKELQGVVAKIDDKQSFWLVLPASSLPPEILNSDEAKKALEGVEVITAGFTITDKLVLKVGVTTKDAESAKSLQKQIKKTLQFATAFLALNEQTAPLADAIAAIKTTPNDKTISLEGELSAEVLEKLFKLADQ